MEFLVEFEVTIPAGTSSAEITDRESAEASAAARLAQQGHLARLWKIPVTSGETKAVGLYVADSSTQLDDLLSALPLSDWIRLTVTPLTPHPNDPAPAPFTTSDSATNRNRLPRPRLTLVYRLEATVGDPLDLGTTPLGQRRIVPLTGGTFTGPELSGKLLPGVSADWQTILSDGTALGDIRYALQTDGGDLLSVQSRGVRHGSAEVLSRLGRGEHVDASEYIFRTSTQIETAAADLEWLNKGVFIGVGGRQPGGVIYETYLVG
jgi:muconolactone delta-isomerase